MRVERGGDDATYAFARSQATAFAAAVLVVR